MSLIPSGQPDRDSDLTASTPASASEVAGGDLSDFVVEGAANLRAPGSLLLGSVENLLYEGNPGQLSAKYGHQVRFSVSLGKGGVPRIESVGDGDVEPTAKETEALISVYQFVIRMEGKAFSSASANYYGVLGLMSGSTRDIIGQPPSAPLSYGEFGVAFGTDSETRNDLRPIAFRISSPSRGK
ncbi:MAG: hypothetical protein KDD70_08280 [Bdellovibrionales bacterium]|nr:hypothetical protein [Bdellovibrionales bacterium]